MKNIKTIDNDVIYDVRTGCGTIFDKKHDTDHNYAFLLKFGHCGSGYFIPILTVISAKSPELAVKIAKNMSGVKKTNNYSVLAMKEIDEITAKALQHINDCDPYLYLPKSNMIPNLYERRVIMEEAVIEEPGRKNTRHDGGRKIFDIKTADEYARKYVLQRYTAPVLVGDKYVFPKKFKLERIIDDHIFYNTIILGLKRGKVNALSWYYQLYGENNKLGIKYNKGVITYKNTYGENIEVDVPDEIVGYLDDAKVKFSMLPEENKPEILDVTIPSAKERFYKRYKKEEIIDERE